MYPEYIEVNSNQYKINTDYKVALSCFRAINDDEISDLERAYAVLVLLLGKNVKQEDEEEALKKCAIYLRCGKEQNDELEEPDFDFEQDVGYITASFRSDYSIDLTKEDMHWYLYNELIEGLTSNCILSKIRELRNFNTDDIQNEKEKEKIIKAKERVALKKKITKEEQEEIDEFNSLFE